MTNVIATLRRSAALILFMAAMGLAGCNAGSLTGADGPEMSELDGGGGPGKPVPRNL